MQLMPFQVDAKNFLLSRMPPHGVIALDTGLGKTPTDLVAFKESGAKTSLTTCPASLKDYWAEQMYKWTDINPDETFIVRSSNDTIPQVSHIIVNYEYMRYPAIKQQLLQRKFAWGRWDEAQRLKSQFSQRTGHILGSGGVVHQAVFKSFLSGTITPNRPIELFPLLATCAPQTIHPYTNEETFGKYFCDGFYNGTEMVYKGASHIEELKERIAPFIFIRTVDQVYSELPPYIERNIPIRESSMVNSVRDTDLATLRKLTGVAKFIAIRNYLIDQMAYNPGEKMLVFCFTRDLIDLLYEWFSPRGLCVKLYGGMKQSERDAAKKKFLEDESCSLFFLQYQAGGTGTDGLQDVCNRFVAAEPEWSPGERWQAMGRLRRIGQTKPVLCDNLILEGSLDELIEWRCAQKAQVLTQLLKPNNLEFNKMTDNEALVSIAESLATLVEIMNQPEGQKQKKETAAEKKARVQAEKEAQAAATLGISTLEPTAFTTAVLTIPQAQSSSPSLNNVLPLPGLPSNGSTPPTSIPSLPTMAPLAPVPTVPTITAPANVPTVSSDTLAHTVQSVMAEIAARLGVPMDHENVKAYITHTVLKYVPVSATIPTPMVKDLKPEDWAAFEADLKAIIAPQPVGV